MPRPSPATAVDIHSRAWCVPRNNTLGRVGESSGGPIFTARIGRPSYDAPTESTWISVFAAAQAAKVARMPLPGLSNEWNERKVSAAAPVVTRATLSAWVLKPCAASCACVSGDTTITAR